MMVALYIIVAVLALIVALLFLNFSLVFELNETFSFKMKVFIFNFNAEKFISLFTSEKKEQKINEQVKEIKKKKKTTLPELLDVVLDVFNLVRLLLAEIIKYARLKLCYIDVKVATDDAAETALIYGSVSGAIYSAVELLDAFLNVKKNYKKINIYPSFSETKPKIKLKIILSVKPIHVIFTAMHVLPKIAKKQKGL